MSRVVNNDILVMTEKVRVQKMLDTLHRLVLVWLLLDEHRVRIQGPLAVSQVRLERLEQPIRVLRRDT